MKKLIKLLIIFNIGVFSGYYVCKNNPLKLLNNSYKAFQVGVYTSLDAANTYKTKYKDAIIIKDNELYRVYVSILKKENNIETMSKYLNENNIDYYIKEINIDNKELIKELNNYENVMNTNNEVVFLSINKMIIEKYEESI